MNASVPLVPVLSTESAPLVRLLDRPLAQIRQYFEENGEKAFRAQQLIRWVFKRGVNDPLEMSDMGMGLRERLSESVDLSFPEIIWDKVTDDGTRKWLLRLPDGNAVETVYIPEQGRGTLCVSSQVGCGLNCTFCSTGKQGFNRHLTQSEILGQFWQAQQALKRDLGLDHPITNVVFMGMGEPLLNTGPVFGAVEILLHDWAYGLSKYRVTISTAGVVPKIYEMADQIEASLAISLHAPTDALRDELVPINKRYPLSELMGACDYYLSRDPRRHILLEYVLLKDVNDQPLHAQQLVELLTHYGFDGSHWERHHVKVNLIPFNPFPHAPYQRPERSAVLRFQAMIREAGWVCTVRKTRGEEVDAACGQLVGRFDDRTSRSRLYQQKIQAQKTQAHMEKSEDGHLEQGA